MDGIIIKKHKKRYIVDSGGISYGCSIRGRLYKEIKDARNIAVVGDRVTFEETGEEEGIITEIKPRRRKLSKSSIMNPFQEHVIVANVDQLLVVTSVKNPDFDADYVDRFIAAGEKRELHVVLCINKLDLKKDKKIDKYAGIYKSIGYDVVLTSALTGNGLEELKDLMRKKISVMAGQSGVGKSTIINVLQPGLNLRVRNVNPKTGEGTHTTTSVSLFRLDFDAYIVDTPGIREFNLWDISKDTLHYYFREFRELSSECRFKDCSHVTEPGCAVREGVDSGVISKERYNGYINILRSLK